MIPTEFLSARNCRSGTCCRENTNCWLRLATRLRAPTPSRVSRLKSTSLTWRSHPARDARATQLIRDMTHPPPSALKKFLKPFDPAVRDLALQLRALVLEEMAPCYENIYDAYSAVSIGYGTSDRLKDGIFHIAVYAKAVNLGFNDGATLDDPKGILLGSGNRIRHITIRTVTDLQKPEIRSYIRRARKKALTDAARLGEQIEKPAGVVSTVKAIYAKKRRPK